VHAGDGRERVHSEELVLDIGGGVGALVLYTGPELAAQQIEVSLEGEDRARIHTAVHERRVMGRAVFAGVFPELREGRYRIWTDDPTRVAEVTIVSGSVAEVDWR
jgi:hypothetical protein